MPRLAVLALVPSLAACGGRAGDSATTPVPGGAEEGPAPAPAPGPSPAEASGGGGCHAYVQRALDCARLESEGELPLDRAASLAERLSEACDDWMGDEGDPDSLRDTLEECESTCESGLRAWNSCVAEGLGLDAPRRGGEATVDRPPPARIEPRPIPPDVDPCELWLGWSMDCIRQEMPGAELPPEVIGPITEGYRQACDSFRSTPEMSEAFPEALRACADVACGPGGSDLAMCIGERLGAAAAGGPGGSADPAEEAVP